MSSILDQFNNQDEQDNGNQFVDTVEAFGALRVIHAILWNSRLITAVMVSTNVSTGRR
jgi:hypothetical protein